MPQVSYDQQALLLGQVADNSPLSRDTYTNPLLAQLSAITWGGNDAGTYEIQIEGAGEKINASIVADGIDAITVLIAAMIVQLQAQEGFSGMATAANSDPDLDLAFLTTGVVYIISFPQNPSGNLTVANDTDAGGTNIPLAVAVAQGGDGLAVLPTGVADVLLGLTSRNVDVETNEGGQGDSEFSPGDAMSVVRQGVVTVRATTTVVDGNPVFVRHAAATVAEPLGSLSATDDGNTVQLPGSRWRGARTGAGLTRVTVNIP